MALSGILGSSTLTGSNRMSNDDKMALKAKIISRLGEIACEHSKEHQPVKSNRYVICSTSGVKIELMFQKDCGSAVNLWVKEEFVEQLIVNCLPWNKNKMICDGMICEPYPACSILDDPYGRHSSLRSMPQLCEAALIRFELSKMGDLERILSLLAPAKKPACS